ncbi:hypothetical protein AAC387_Pa07g0382 [Persea americana]
MKKAGEASTSERQKDVEMGGSGSHGNGDCTCSEFLDEASTSERQKDVEMGGSGSHGNGDCTCTESLDEASSSERQKDVEMGGSGSHGNGDCTCTETQWVEYIKKKLNENKLNTRTFDDLPPDMADIYTGAQAFYRKKRNKWKAILKQKYMDSPWAIISVVFGGVLILLLTIIQVVYAILTYHKPPS